ncbi:MAG: hypothetical protein GY712_04845, partial [Oceanicoccus sp.]|uniref:hypothetical protein n=1 Tax=Oceanicoccus sp. TaxID=2691044 RepID=UPI0026373BFE
MSTNNGQDIMAQAVQVQYPETATDGDLAGFHAPAEERIQLPGQAQEQPAPIQQQSAEGVDFDIESFMRGEQVMDGSQHALNPQGITSENYTDQEGILFETQQFQQEHLMPQANTYNTPAPQAEGNVDWKAMYGRSENEKGELRRALAEQVRITNGQVQTTQPVVNVPAPAFFTPQGQVQPQAVPQPVYDPSRVPRLINKPDGEPVFAEDLQEALTTHVGPFVAETRAVAIRAQEEVERTKRALFESEKARLGLDPSVEQGLLNAHPWLAGINDPNAYLKAAAAQLQTASSTALLNRPPQGVRESAIPQVRQAIPQNPQQQRVARAATYIERGQSGTSTDQRPTPHQSAETEWKA